MSKRKQPQRLPPPIMHGGEAIDSGIVLLEFPGELGLLFWKTIRTARLWAELPDGERARGFDEEAHARRIERIESVDIPGRVAGPLTKAAAVLQPRARSATVAGACRDLSDWAVESGRLGTALEFMQTAAVVLPQNAEIARLAARLATQLTQYPRAEMWYRQAISRARKGRLWYDFSRAYIGLGIVFIHRGNFPQARKSLIRGLRAAKRFSIRELVAAAYHELAVVAIRTDRFEEVTRHVRAALQAYGPGHPRLTGLAHDYGVYLMKAGYFDAALRTLRACQFDDPVDQLAGAAAVARAAGGAGEESVYHTARSQADALLRDPGTMPCATNALFAIARGAASLGRFELALEYGTTAHQDALEKGEFALQHEIDAFLESVRTREAATTAPAKPLQPLPESVAGAVAEFETVLRAKQLA